MSSKKVIEFYRDKKQEQRLRFQLAFDEKSFTSCYYCKRRYTDYSSNQCDIPITDVENNSDYFNKYNRRYTYYGEPLKMFENYIGTPSDLNSFTQCPYFKGSLYSKMRMFFEHLKYK